MRERKGHSKFGQKQNVHREDIELKSRFLRIKTQLTNNKHINKQFKIIIIIKLHNYFSISSAIILQFLNECGPQYFDDDKEKDL